MLINYNYFYLFYNPDDNPNDVVTLFYNSYIYVFNY